MSAPEEYPYPGEYSGLGSEGRTRSRKAPHSKLTNKRNGPVPLSARSAKVADTSVS
jgi:hypothetical protein